MTFGRSVVLPALGTLLGACGGPGPGDTDSSSAETGSGPSLVPESCQGDGEGVHVLYVIPGAERDGDGSPAHPFGELQDAVDAAEPFTEIRMAPGEYPLGASATDVTRHQGLRVRACESGTVTIDGSLIFAGRATAALMNVSVEGIVVNGALGVMDVQPIELRDVDVTNNQTFVVQALASTIYLEGTVGVHGGRRNTDSSTAAVKLSDCQVVIGGEVTLDAIEADGDYGWWQDSGSLVVDGSLRVEVPVDRTAALVLTSADLLISGNVSAVGGVEAMLVGSGGTVSVEDGASLDAHGGGSWGLALVGDASLVIDGTATVDHDGAYSSVQVQDTARLAVSSSGSLTIASQAGQVGVALLGDAELVIDGTATVDHSGEYSAVQLGDTTTLVMGAGGALTASNEEGPSGVLLTGNSSAQIGGHLLVDHHGIQGAVQLMADSSLDFGPTAVAEIRGGPFAIEATSDSRLRIEAGASVAVAGASSVGFYLMDAAHAEIEGELRVEQAGGSPGVQLQQDSTLLVGPGATVAVVGGERGLGVIGNASLVVQAGGSVALSGGTTYGLVLKDDAVIDVGGALSISLDGGTAALLTEGDSELLAAAGSDVQVSGSAMYAVATIERSTLVLGGAWSIDQAGAYSAVEVADAGSLSMEDGATLDVTGGSIGLRVAGTGSAALTNASFASATSRGVQVSGGTLTTSGQLTITDPAGYGLDISGSATVDLAELRLSGAHGLGVRARDSALTVRGGSITDTVADGYGDGVLVEDPTALALSGLTLTGNPRAGVFVTSGDGLLMDSIIGGGAYGVVQRDCSNGTLQVTNVDTLGSADPVLHLCDDVVAITAPS